MKLSLATHEVLQRVQRELAHLLNRSMTMDETLAWLLKRAPMMLKRQADGPVEPDRP